MAVAILPVLRIGGMQLFRTESADKLERIRPRMSQVTAPADGGLFRADRALCGRAAGRRHGVRSTPSATPWRRSRPAASRRTTPRSASMAARRSRAIIALFMILGGSTFLLLARAVEGDWRTLWRDVQLRWYLTYIALFVLAHRLVAGRGRRSPGAERDPRQPVQRRLARHHHRLRLGELRAVGHAADRRGHDALLRRRLHRVAGRRPQGLPLLRARQCRALAAAPPRPSPSHAAADL